MPEPASGLDVAATDEWIVSTASIDAEALLQSLRDQTVFLDGKCQQVMAMVLTVAALLGAAAATLSLSGGVPTYAVAIPGIGTLMLTFGIWMGLRAISGDIPVLGSQPSAWMPYLGWKTTRHQILLRKLKRREADITKAREIVRIQSRRIELMKKNVLITMLVVIASWSIFCISDELHFRPWEPPFKEWRGLATPKKGS